MYSMAAHNDGYSPRCSCTMRTARSRTSGENLFDFFIAPSSQRLEPPQNPGRFIRMCVPGGKYPAVTPIKKLRPTHIKPGSPFELAVQGVDVAKQATGELRTALLRTSVKL